jgi:hypothetical protein
MSDEEKENVAQSQEVIQPSESAETQDDRQEEAKEIEQPTRKGVDYNWAEARRTRQELERQNEELRSQIQRLSQKDAPVEDDLSKLSEDDIITVKQHRQSAKQIAKQVAEEVIRQREAATMEERLLMKYPDFSQIVSPENIELLKQSEPELALSLHSLQHDPYSQAVAAYKLLKKTVPPQKNVTQEKKKALENSQKPVSVQAVTKQSAIGSAHAFENGLTPDLKKQLWAEMQQAMKG